MQLYVWLPSISCYRWLSLCLLICLFLSLSLCPGVCLFLCLILYVILSVLCVQSAAPSMLLKKLTAAVMLQIMLRLQAQDRPEIPDLDNLPGQPLPGITQYIKLMKVWGSLCDAASLSVEASLPTSRATGVPCTCPPLPAACLVHVCVCPPVCLPFLQLVLSTCAAILLSVVTASDHMVASGSTHLAWKSA